MAAHPVIKNRIELQERIADWLDLPLSVLAVIMLGLLIVDLTMQLTPAWERRVSEAETAIWVIFAADFVVELALAPSKVRYLKRNWLTAIAVLLPAFRAIRIVRVAQMLRGLSLLRILTTLNRGTRALGHVARRGQLGYVLLLTAAVTVTAAAAGYYFERGEPGASITTVGDALWWATTLVTTINTSLETTTLEGHIVGLLLRLFALGVTGYLTAIIAVYLLGQRDDAEQAAADQAEIQQLRAEIASLRAMLERLLPEPAPPAESSCDHRLDALESAMHVKYEPDGPARPG